MIKYIHIDYRKPRTKSEKRYFALSNVDVNAADVFINTRKNKKMKDLVDTFFHEMAHVFIAFHAKDGQMTEQQEEMLCEALANKCSEVLL